MPFDDAEKIGVEERMAGRRQALPGGARNGVGGGAGADGRFGHGGVGRWQPESEPAAGGLVPAGAACQASFTGSAHFAAALGIIHLCSPTSSAAFSMPSRS